MKDFFSKNKVSIFLKERWWHEDHPGGSKRFQYLLPLKDLCIALGISFVAIMMYRLAVGPASGARISRKSSQANRDSVRSEQSRSQIIEFESTGKPSSRGGSRSPGYAGVEKRSPGALVKVKLLNVVETYSTAPVHGQIVDEGLGRSLMGGTLIGDATPDTTFERISIGFRYVRDPNRDSIAIPISARALGLDGTLGLVATKKEGFFARAAMGSAGTASQDAQGSLGGNDFKQILFRALTTGLVQEFGSGAQVERNRANVLALAPPTEFFAELTDFFPGGSK